MDQGLMTLPYKKGLREELEKWRPITLLNFEYKLLAKVLPEHLKSIIGTVIHEDSHAQCWGDRYTEPYCNYSSHCSISGRGARALTC